MRSSRPVAESLEERILLYSTFGNWTYSSRVTYSFMPDGTSIGGVPSVLFQALNAKYPTVTWENQIEQGASLWESSANVNLAQVPDDGEAFGVSGDQQDDPRFGDIRIGAIPLPSNVLAETFLPPPTNGGTAAGDIMFNSTINWQIGTGYDLATVAAHEFGHALGLGESTVSGAVMYGDYNGIKDALASDDVNGIQSLYLAPQFDQFNSILRNTTPLTATNLTGYLNSSEQLSIGGLDNTVATQCEWYAINVPATNDGKMVVTVQSSNLSSLAPALYVYSSTLSQVATAGVANTYGATIWTSNSVTAGQKYYIKVMSGGTYGRVGDYGLQVNFTSQTMSPVQPPNTLVLQQPNGGGYGMDNAISSTGASPAVGSLNTAMLEQGGAVWTTIGDLQTWAAPMMISASTGPVTVPVGQPSAPAPTSQAPAPVPTSQTTATGGPIAPLTASSTVITTTTTPASPSVGVQAGPLSASGTSVSSGHKRHKAHHHAVDASLAGWNGHRKRPQARAKARSDMHDLS